MTIRTIWLSSWTTGFPAPPNNSDDSCVEQKTDNEYDTGDALRMSRGRKTTPVSRGWLIVVPNGQSTADQLQLSLRCGVSKQIQLLKLLLVMRMGMSRRSGMMASHFNNPEPGTTVAERFEYLQFSFSNCSQT